MRKSGIELLRILAMLMIVTLHVLGAGGVLDATEPLSTKYSLLWFWEILSYGAVNCFALISGWGMSDKKASYMRLLKFGLTVYIITFAIWILRWNENTTWKLVLISSFPFNTYQWYVKSYIGVLILTPVLNAFLQNGKPQELCIFSFVSITIFSIVTLISQGDPFHLSKGGSVLWLCILYIHGGIIKRLDLYKKLTLFQRIGGYILFTVLTWGSKVGIEYLHMMRTGEYVEHNTFVSYISPFIILQSLCLFLVFLKMDFKMPKFIYHISGSVFGIYIIHMHHRIVGPYITDHFAYFSEYNPIKMCGAVLLKIFQIFFICLISSMILMKCINILWHVLERQFEKLQQK